MGGGYDVLVWIVYFTASGVYRRQILVLAYEAFGVG